MSGPGTAPLRAAVIGCGAIAYEHLPYLATSRQARLVAVCDRSPAMAKAAQSRFGAEACYGDVAMLLAEARPDIVHVLTPPHSHDAIVRQALAAGSHVICEKPMTGTAAETEALLGAAQSAGRVLMESRNLLFNDAVLDLQRLIAAGRLGRVVECDILLTLNFLAGPFGDENLTGPSVLLPGGAIQDFLPHLTYLFLSLTGVETVGEVRGFLANRSGNPRAVFDFLDTLLDAGPVRGRLRIATDVQPDAFRIALRGTMASVETDLYNPFLRLDGAPNTGKRAPLGQIANGFGLIRAGLANFRNKVMQHGTTHGLPRMLDAIYTAIRTGGALPFTPREMLATARLTDRIVALKEPA